MNTIRMVHRISQNRIVQGSVPEVFPGFTPGERWLFVSPHDDDVVIGGGLVVQAALAAGVQVRCCVVTDGRMGYTNLDHRASIVDLRAKETTEAFEVLGVSDLKMFGYPDADLYVHAGRRRIGAGRGQIGTGGVPHVQAGHTGLQNSFTAELREFRPHRTFVMSIADFHPDHKLVNQELTISLFHAMGPVWPELGDPIEQPPSLYELAAYRKFVAPPDYQMVGDDAAFRTKLDAIAAFRSQSQIEPLVRRIEAAGPYEYFRTVPFDLYDPADYKSLFEGNKRT